MKKVLIFIGLGLAVFIIVAVFSSRAPKTVKYAEDSSPSSNVYIENGKQIVEISAKGGYSPRQTTAKADLPTAIRIKTSSTFDCSSSLRIPSINYFKNLPPTGTTDIDIPPQKTGSALTGICSMGMYNFSVQFNG